MRRRRRWCVAPALAVLMAAPATGAQQSEPIEDDLYIPELRPGGRPLYGGGFGIGMFDGRCDDCISRTGMAVEGYGGWQLNPRVALLANASWTIHLLPVDGENPGFAGYLSLTAGPQVWIVPELYIRVGVGAGSLAVISSMESGLDLGPGIALTVGGELGHRPRSGIDLSLQGAASSVRSETLGDFLFFSAAALVGYHRN